MQLFVAENLFRVVRLNNRNRWCYNDMKSFYVKSRWNKNTHRVWLEKEAHTYISTKRCRQLLYKTPKCKTKCGAFDLCYCLIQNYLRHMPLILQLLQRFVGFVVCFFSSSSRVCMLTVKAVFPSYTNENGMERDSIKEWVCTSRWLNEFRRTGSMLKRTEYSEVFAIRSSCQAHDNVSNNSTD